MLADQAFPTCPHHLGHFILRNAFLFLNEMSLVLYYQCVPVQFFVPGHKNLHISASADPDPQNNNGSLSVLDSGTMTWMGPFYLWAAYLFQVGELRYSLRSSPVESIGISFPGRLLMNLKYLGVS